MTRARALSLALIAAASCRSSGEPARAPELDVPAMPPSSAPQPPAARARPSAKSGWIYVGGALDPRYVDARATLDAIGRAGERALLRFDARFEECSSMGGTHAFFTIHASAAAPPKEGWCVEKAPLADAKVVALLPIEDAAEGERLLGDLPR